MEKKIYSYSSNKSMQFAKVVSSVCVVANAKIKTKNRDVNNLASMFLVFLKSIPAASGVDLCSELEMKNSTKTILGAIHGNEIDPKVDSNTEELINEIPSLKHELIKNLNSLSKNTIKQAKNLFSSIKSEEEAIQTCNKIRTLSIEKYTKLPQNHKDIAEESLFKGASNFAKLCYIFGFTQ